MGLLSRKPLASWHPINKYKPELRRRIEDVIKKQIFGENECLESVATKYSLFEGKEAGVDCTVIGCSNVDEVDRVLACKSDGNSGREAVKVLVQMFRNELGDGDLNYCWKSGK